MKYSKPLNRRTMLKSAGVSIGLPLLEAMAPIGKTAFAQQQKPTRFLAAYTPVGFVLNKFLANSDGPNYTMPDTLKPIEAFKKDFLMVRNSYNEAEFPDGDGGAHAHGTGAFLTAKRLKLPKTGTRHAISVDQVMANAIGDQTPIKSLHFSEQAMTNSASASCDTGWACAFIYHISWRADGTYNSNITDPKKAFDAVFRKVGGGGTDPANSLDPAESSVLDHVLEDITSLKKKLGSQDSEKLDQYFTSIRELEEDLSSNGGSGNAACQNLSPPDDPTGGGSRKAGKRIDLMSDICALAFQCDATRVITHMFDRGASKRTFNDQFSDHSNTHHNYSHHGNNAGNLKKLLQIEYWEMQRFAYLLDKLKNTKDVSGTSLLDSSMVFFSSEVNEGDKHRYQNMPLIIAGTGNGFLKTGQAISLNNTKRDFGRIFETMIKGMGINDYGRFGDYGGSGMNTDIIA